MWNRVFPSGREGGERETMEMKMTTVNEVKIFKDLGGGWTPFSFFSISISISWARVLHTCTFFAYYHSV
jgi:hypothetical protein